MKFNELKLTEPILKALTKQGYDEPSPIQEKAIPFALEGRDILGCAQTGTGKTAAFSLPTIQRLGKHDKTKIRSLILTPTRELAIQISENILAYSKFTDIKSTVIFGGVKQNSQVRAIKAGVDIVVATPGRLNDLINQKVIDISHVEIFILDEADRMLDMGFINDIKKVINRLPKQKQTLFFSATMPKEIKDITDRLLHDPITVEVTPVSSTVDKIDQTLYYVDKPNKKKLLVDLLEKENVFNALVFTRTKNNANRLEKYLKSNDIKTGVIHGDKSQGARQNALKNFKNGKTRVLVATDIAARGIDVNDLTHVFNYDMPEEAEAYVHRIGRTGRAGKEGTSISFSDINEKNLVKDVEKLINYKIPVESDHEFPMVELTPTPKKSHGRNKRSNNPKSSRSTSGQKTSSRNNPNNKNKSSRNTSSKRTNKFNNQKPKQNRRGQRGK